MSGSEKLTPKRNYNGDYRYLVYGYGYAKEFLPFSPFGTGDVVEMSLPGPEIDGYPWARGRSRLRGSYKVTPKRNYNGDYR
ncbi:hypothetical protein AK812_SmicGene28666 [Symbiodinium microadriaticum]|uniref:Uncharacterized protein n=1 Tax=Symbiodinium microadriaticum TaxID=2951 RepID=A0A1Q9D3X1_SYMMI|nr:hypothetical protein AK812_SmicGene28666 [Symbiodinium microadriaticum]